MIFHACGDLVAKNFFSFCCWKVSNNSVKMKEDMKKQAVMEQELKAIANNVYGGDDDDDMQSVDGENVRIEVDRESSRNSRTGRSSRNGRKSRSSRARRERRDRDGDVRSNRGGDDGGRTEQDLEIAELRRQLQQKQEQY